MPNETSKGHLWWRETKAGRVAYAIWYRNGSRFCVNTHKTDESQARGELERLIAERDAGSVKGSETAPPSIVAMLNEALRHYKRKGRKSYDCAKRHSNRLKKALAGKRADEITTDDVNEYAESRQDDGAANATANRELALLRLAFNLARKAGKIKPEMMPCFETLPENNRRTGFFEQEQYEAVLAKLPDYLKGVLTMGYWTGMRKAEILGLTWDRVDLFNRLIFLERCKNGEDRTLTLNEELLEMMQGQAQSRAEGCPFVFHRYGERIQSFAKAWKTACKDAGCPGKLVHDLRRTGVRNLIRSGVSQSVAMKISGHKDARIFERYNIVDTLDVAEAMQKLSQYEQKKRLARAERVIDVHASFTGAVSDDKKPVLARPTQSKSLAFSAS
jgi:integrase